MAGIYVHIPFCRRRCLYCDFYSVGESLADWTLFTDALCNEANDRVPDFFKIPENGSNTIYIGGGTPSLIPEVEFKRLAETLLKLASDPAEFTLEVNPDDVTQEKARFWHDAGVSRISMGVQSFIDKELKGVGRRHSPAQALKAFENLRPFFDNISLDLMFGLPFQTLDSLAFSVNRIIDLAPEHVSVYSLMYEERSALTALRTSGKVIETPESESVRMFEYVNDVLPAAGLKRYEISNFARPGFESRHNSAYWHQIPYIGIGPAAHSYDGFRYRRANAPDVREYVRRKGNNILYDSEYLSEDEVAEEWIMTRLRTVSGLDLEMFKIRFGTNRCDRLIRDAQPWIQSGHLELKPDLSPDSQEPSSSLSLTDKGIMISDEIMASMF